MWLLVSKHLNIVTAKHATTGEGLGEMANLHATTKYEREGGKIGK